MQTTTEPPVATTCGSVAGGDYKAYIDYKCKTRKYCFCAEEDDVYSSHYWGDGGKFCEFGTNRSGPPFITFHYVLTVFCGCCDENAASQCEGPDLSSEKVFRIELCNPSSSELEQRIAEAVVTSSSLGDLKRKLRAICRSIPGMCEYGVLGLFKNIFENCDDCVESIIEHHLKRLYSKPNEFFNISYNPLAEIFGAGTSKPYCNAKECDEEEE